MRCHACGASDPPGLCGQCVAVGIRAHRSQYRSVQNAAAQLVKRAKAQQAATGPAQARELKAKHARLSRTTEELRAEQAHLTEANEQARRDLEDKTAQLARRRANLAEARKRLAQQLVDDTSPFATQPSSPSKSREVSLAELHDRIAGSQHKWDELAENAAHRRQTLAARLIELFHPEMRAVAAPSKVSKLRSGPVSKPRPQQIIAGNVLPRPSELRACTSRTLPQTNAAVSWLAQCLLQLSRYFGLVLPFTPELNATPAICATPAKAWATRYPQRQTLVYDPGAKTQADSSHATVGLKPLPSSFTSFLTGYTMLMYDLAYLCASRGLAVDLASTPSVIDALLSLADLHGSIRPSDALSYKPVPAELAAFTALDFGLLLESNISAASHARKGAGQDEGVDVAAEDDDGFAVVRITEPRKS